MSRILAALLLLLTLSACTRDEHWHQRLTLVVRTPAGEVTGSVVQRIDWQGTTGFYKTATQGVDASQTSLRVTGEALALEVAPGKWLFALLKGDRGWQGEPGSNAGFAIAVPLGHFARSPEGGMPFSPSRRTPPSPCPPRPGR